MKEKVFSIVSQTMNVPIENVTEETSPETVENWDSLMHMNLVLALEEEFDVAFDDEQIVNMLSVGTIINIIQKLK